MEGTPFPALERPHRSRATGPHMARRIVVLAVSAWVGAACKPGCGTDSFSAKPSASGTGPSLPTRALQTTAPTGGTNSIPSPVTLLKLDKSAYHARLDLEPDAIYLLTMDAAFRLVPGQKPEETKLDLSDIGVATPSAFIYWSNGSFYLAPKRGGTPGPLARVKNRPIYIVAAGERFAWIGPNEQGHHTVYVLRAGKPDAIYVMQGTAAAATMVDDRVVFVEQLGSRDWRLGSVPLEGPPSFTPTRKGRYPSMLAPAEDVYYYFFDDKDVSEVWAVSPDLHSERVVARNVVCSPLAATDHVFCGQMEGLFEISPRTGLSKLVYPSIGSSITTIAADQNRVVWVSDVGTEKLEVSLLSVRGNPTAR